MLRALVGGAAQAPDRFSVASAQASLDRSLTALKTDYLDILFLHDCAHSDLTDELAAFLDRQVATGKIRAYGVATDIEAVVALYAQRGDTMLYQFPNSIGERNADRLPTGESRFIAHSPFAGSARVAGRLAATVAGGDVHHVMLAQALAVPNVAVVLCSMLDESHLSANIAAVERPRFSAVEIAQFADLIAEPMVRAPAA
jgi:aryl-alcohol dehydrogenase-like predicted oxidoreductase